MKTSADTHVPLPRWQALPDTDMLARASAFADHLSTRRSVRQFSDKPVPRDIIEACVRAAGTSPSGANHQPWHFACVGSAEKKREIRLAAEAEEREFYAGRAGEEWLDALAPIGTDADKPYMETAPWLICIFAQRRGGVREGEDRKNYYIHESVGIATGLLIAACHEAGLATLVHTPNPTGVCQAGSCTYAETTVDCALTGKVCKAAACVAPASSSAMASAAAFSARRGSSRHVECGEWMRCMIWPSTNASPVVTGKANHLRMTDDHSDATAIARNSSAPVRRSARVSTA